MEHVIYLSIIHILCFYICTLKIKHTAKSKWILFLLPEVIHLYFLVNTGIKGYFGWWDIKLNKVDDLVDKIKMVNDDNNS